MPVQADMIQALAPADMIQALAPAGMIQALAPADEASGESHVGEIRLAESKHQGEEIEEELPSVEELESGH